MQFIKNKHLDSGQGTPQLGKPGFWSGKPQEFSAGSCRQQHGKSGFAAARRPEKKHAWQAVGLLQGVNAGAQLFLPEKFFESLRTQGLRQRDVSFHLAMACEAR